MTSVFIFPGVSERTKHENENKRPPKNNTEKTEKKKKKKKRGGVGFRGEAFRERTEFGGAIGRIALEKVLRGNLWATSEAGRTSRQTANRGTKKLENDPSDNI